MREYFNDTSLCLVEWPEKGGELLPEPDLRVRLEIFEAGRGVRLLGLTEAGKICVAHLSRP